MKKVAHFVEKFPNPGNEYIYNQFLDNEKIKSILIAEWLAKSRDHARINLFYHKKCSQFSFLNRLNNKLNGGIFNKLYIKKLNSYAQRILEDNQISIIHAHFGMAGYKLIDLKKNLNIPFVVTFYGVDASYCLRQKSWLDRYRRLFEEADILIVLCEEVRNRFLNLGCPE